MPLEDHANHEDIDEHDEKRTHAPHPPDAHRRLPLCDDEDADQPEYDAIRVQRDRSLDRVRQEALDDVVVAHRQRQQRTEPDQEGGQREDHEVQVVLEARAPEAQSDRQ